MISLNLKPAISDIRNPPCHAAWLLTPAGDQGNACGDTQSPATAFYAAIAASSPAGENLPTAVGLLRPVKTPTGERNTLLAAWLGCDSFLDSEIPPGDHVPVWVWNPSASSSALASSLSRRAARKVKVRDGTARRISLRERASINPREVSGASVHS